jgi:hypothetical protein
MVVITPTNGSTDYVVASHDITRSTDALVAPPVVIAAGGNLARTAG